MSNSIIRMKARLAGFATIGLLAAASMALARDEGASLHAASPLRLPGESAEARASGDLSSIAAKNASVTAPVVNAAELNPGSTVERDLCLTIAIGMDAAAECGDLRVIHELPSARTLGRARGPVLFYNSDHAAPYSVVRADVTLPDGVTGLSRVRAVLRVNGAARAQSVYKGSAWPSGGSARIALAFDASGEATNILRYTLEVTSFYGTDSSKTTASGDLGVVNLKQSYFGSGWWLAGLDRLVLDPLGLPTLWIGGDGSVRRYRLAGVNVWVAPSVDRPDTLKKVGSNFARLLPGGIKVLFDSLGRHVTTRAATGHKTTFAYDAAGRLSAVFLPNADTLAVQDSTKLKYSFIYGPTGNLKTVEAPGVGLPRLVTLYSRDGKVDSIGGPDTTKVGFIYLNWTSGRIVARTNRARVKTKYSYDAGRKISASQLDLASGESIILNLRAHETLGLVDANGAGALAPTAAYAKLDGPRTDVGDSATFTLDRFGSPRVVRDALGNETALTKADPSFPALVTKVRYPNGRIVSAAYDTRGNVTSTTDSSTFEVQGGSTIYSTTAYTWDPRWDNVTGVTSPEGIVSTFAYDTLTGNRLWQQIGPDSARRVRFSYGSRRRQLEAIAEPGVIRPDSIQHDDRGNPVRTISSLGIRTEIVNDSIGRLQKIFAPLDASDTLFHREWREYDVMDRVVRVTVTAPVDTSTQMDTTENGDPIPLPPPGSTAEALSVANTYGPEGNLLSVSRLGIPGGGIGSIETLYEYDAALRKVKEIAPDGAVDSTVYDLAGNAIAVHTRRTDPTSGERIVVRMTYDALNRLVERRVPQVNYPERLQGIPTKSAATAHDGATNPYPQYPNDGAGGYLIAADTARYTYDLMGQMLTAENRDARVKRSYYLNGALKTDTLRTRTLAELSSGGSFDSHVYGGEFFHDLDGRRTELKHPSSLAPTIAGVLKDRTTYSYDALTGELSSITDQLGHQFAFAYSNRGFLQSITRPGDISEMLGYDAGGRLSSHTVLNGSSSPYAYYDTQIRWANFQYDRRDKLTRTASNSGTKDTLVAVYSPLGYVTDGHTISHTRSVVGAEARVFQREDVDHDGLGNQLLLTSETERWFDGVLVSYSASTKGYGYEPGVGRLKSFAGDTIYHDGAGNELFRTAKPSSSSPRALRDVASFYSADGKLAATDARSLASDDPMVAAFFTRVFEEYRYDALGRRILVRSRRSCDTDPENWEAECRQSKIRRVVWDGDEELYEIQMPGSDSSIYLENDTAQVVLAPDDANGQGNAIDPNPYYGRVAYANALGIDQPVSVTRMGYGDRFNQNNADVGHRVLPPFLISPLWNERGQAYLGTFDDGGVWKCQNSGSDTLCVSIGWAEQWFAYMRPNFRPTFWHGGAIEDKAEHSGLLYRRNRYYDSEKGRFTQEDPIGLEGGVNLYGFAGGDPVNFSDPFGLCPRCVMAGARGGMVVGGTLGSVVPGAGSAMGGVLGGIAGGVAAYIAWKELSNRAAESSPGRTIDNPGSLEGATPGEVEGAVPEGWVKSPSREGGGTRWLNPDRPGEAVRVQPGNPRDPNPIKRGPYVRVSKDGVRSDPIPLRGNPTRKDP